MEFHSKVHLKTMVRKNSLLKVDARQFQILFLFSFLLYGIFRLDWNFELYKYLTLFISCLGTQVFFILVLKLKRDALLSASITSLGLCILLKSSDLLTTALVGFIGIAVKFIFTDAKRHFLNPANAAIVIALLLGLPIWISPGQWGSEAILFFLVGSLGFVVCYKVSRLDLSIIFLVSFFLFEFLYQVLYLGWPMDFIGEMFSNGALLLFSFFMITDPISTPSHKIVRKFWALGIALLAFVFKEFYYMQGAFIWALFFMSFLTPLLNYFFVAEKFLWKKSLHYIPILNFKMMKMKKVFLIICAMVIFSFQNVNAFCGFYVAKADATIYNKASQVIFVRDGEKSIITMSNDFKGKLKNFAMVVPVPVVLQKNDIKVVGREIFDKLDAYSAPRLVEYYDQNPCNKFKYDDAAPVSMNGTESLRFSRDEVKKEKDYGVRIQAKYNVGEYEILILSATQSTGLKNWLIANGYKIPQNANEVLEPYIKSNMKFFVAKVNLQKFEESGFANLRPLQIRFNSPKFMLPIRLGMANSTGNQDLIIYTLSKKGRVECSNYRTISMPSNLNMPTFIKNDFGNFYAKVFEKKWRSNAGKAVYLEYAWDVSASNYVKCDPCASTPPDYNDLIQAGASWASKNDATCYFTRLHVRYNRQSFPQDLQFQNTPNKENFQVRYILNYPYADNLTCSEANKYIKDVVKRRENELVNYSFYSGLQNTVEPNYLNTWKRKLKPELRKGDSNIFGDNYMAMFLFLFLNLSIAWSIWKLKKENKFINYL